MPNQKIVINTLVLQETKDNFEVKNILPYKNDLTYLYLSDLWNIEIERVKELVLLIWYNAGHINSDDEYIDMELKKILKY
ncbi:MAG: hypothetical protein QM493_07105 [Sulfurovum sp.]